MAIHAMAGLHHDGDGVPKDVKKAFEYNIKSSDMGNVHGMYNVAQSYMSGIGVPNDEKMAKIYFEMAAKNGNVLALVKLSSIHCDNFVVSIGYLRLAAESGDEESMKALRTLYRTHHESDSPCEPKCNCHCCTPFKTKGLLTKDDLADTIRAFHSAQNELRSDERDLAREVPY